jgi:cell wall-associated NlpC family hydrolase
MWKKTSKVVLLAALMAVTAAVPAGASSYTVGNKGDDVLLIQKQLNKLGYRVKTDGVYSKDTASAVTKFQKSKKIEASGKVGGWTYYLLTGKRTLLEKDAPKTAKSGIKYGNETSYSHYSKMKKFDEHDVIGDKLVSSAYKYLGVPYVFGGNTPDGFDCSGFTKYVFSHNGIRLPRMADEQYLLGAKVSRRELVPGDLVFFTTYEPGVSHTGIYVGDDNFISATSSGGIRVDSLNSGYWSSRYVGAKRVRN